MKKFLSKALSILLFLSIVLPSTNTVFAAGEIYSNISVINNAGMPDTVTVTGLVVGDIVKVYSRVYTQLGLSIDTVIGTATAKADKVVKGTQPTASATVSAEFPVATGSVFSLSRTAGIIYVTATRKGMLESDKTPVSYRAEQRTPVKGIEIKEIINNAGMPDTVKVTGLQVGDTVKVYAEPIDKAEAATETESPAMTEDQVEGDLLARLIAAVDAAKQKLDYIEKCAGVGTEVGQLLNSAAPAEAPTYLYKYKYIFDTIITDANSLIDTKHVSAINVTDFNDKITAFFINYINGDTPVGPLLGTGKAKADKVEKGATATASATVNVELPTVTDQSDFIIGKKRVIYVSVTRKALLESDKIGDTSPGIGYGYPEEQKTQLPPSTVTIVNNAVLADTVTVKNLKVGDTVKVYGFDKDGNIMKTAIGIAKAKADKAVKGSTPTASATVSIQQLGKTRGFIHVSVTSIGLLESNYSQQIEFKPEGQTSSPSVINK